MNELNEIIKALKVIQDICEKHYHCADCPLRKMKVIVLSEKAIYLKTGHCMILKILN